MSGIGSQSIQILSWSATCQYFTFQMFPACSSRWPSSHILDIPIDQPCCGLHKSVCLPRLSVSTLPVNCVCVFFRCLPWTQLPSVSGLHVSVSVPWVEHAWHPETVFGQQAQRWNHWTESTPPALIFAPNSWYISSAVTRFWPFWTAYLSLVDICEEIPLLLQSCAIKYITFRF